MLKMNCLAIAVLSICLMFVVQGRSFVDKRLCKVKTDTPADSKFSLQDSTNEVHTRRRRSTKQRSYVFFDNRSGRTVKLSYRNTITRRKYPDHFTVKPGATIDLNTFNIHKWKAKDAITGKRLLICDRKNYIPQGNTKDSKATCIIRRSDQTNTQIGDKYVEMLVVIDTTVQKMHKNDAEVKRYAKILVNLASKVYTSTNLTQHGFKVHLIPSKIILLKEDVIFDYSSEENNLYKACNRMNTFENDGHGNFDHKLFLTRREFGAGGFARSYGMCHRYSSCSIVYDKGFSSALVIAHEVAHSFGVRHDDFSQHSRDVMNDVILADFGNYKWSLRSQHAFLANIRKYKCLDNKPSPQEVYENPGQYYTMEKQCHLENDETFSLFTPLKKNPCKQLRCRIPKWPTFWRPSGRPLEGTECGTNKICMAGECQYKEGFEGSGSNEKGI